MPRLCLSVRLPYAGCALRPLIAAAALSLPAGVSAQASQPVPACSPATLRGAYVYDLQLKLNPPAMPDKQVCEGKGRMLFDGAGAGWDDQSVVCRPRVPDEQVGKVDPQSLTVTTLRWRRAIRYDLAADCSGVVRWLPPAPGAALARVDGVEQADLEVEGDTDAQREVQMVADTDARVMFASGRWQAELTADERRQVGLKP